jgi:hypothetical protein
MRKRFLIHAMLFATVAILGAVYPVQRTEAQAGCCLHRADPNTPWRLTNYSFSECEKLNREDGDSIYEEDGNYWWNSDC